MKRVSKEIILILFFIARILCLEIGTFIILNLGGSNITHAITMPYEKQKTEPEENYPRDVPHKLSAVYPNVQARVHRVGLLNICMTNWGFFGSGRGHSLYDLKESLGGCFNPNPNEEVFAPSAEYPA